MIVLVSSLVLGSLIYVLSTFSAGIMTYCLEMIYELLLIPVDIIDSLPSLGFLKYMYMFAAFGYAGILAQLKFSEMNDNSNANYDISKFVFNFILTFAFVGSIQFVIAKFVIPLNYYLSGGIIYFTKIDLAKALADTNVFNETLADIDVTTTEIAIQQMLTLILTVFVLVKSSVAAGKRISRIVLMYMFSPFAAAHNISGDKVFGALLIDLAAWIISGVMFVILFYFGIAMLTVAVDVNTGNVVYFKYITSISILGATSDVDEFVRGQLNKSSKSSSQDVASIDPRNY